MECLDGGRINIASEKSKPSGGKQVALDVKLPREKKLQQNANALLKKPTEN